jgi:hypothetical protein
MTTTRFLSATAMWFSSGTGAYKANGGPGGDPLSWRLADRVSGWESALVARGEGHLVIGTACKP